MTRRYFGTDGIRGRVGQSPITPDFMLKLGWAVGRVLGRHRRGEKTRNLIIIGKDTRISGYMFESALEAGLVAAGVDVMMTGPMPTPAVAYLTRTFNACAGIVISASHNAFEDNGIKFFSARGAKLPDDIESEIEAELETGMQTADSSGLGKVTRLTDAAGRYIEYCKSTYRANQSLDGLRLVVDCAHGATYHVAPAVFRELGASVETLGVQPDGFNINRDCGSTSPQILAAKVRETGADLGIAFDGDGDRVVFVAANGELVDGDELLYVIAAEHKRRTGGCEGVVGTVMTNMGVELALTALDIPFARAKVGDRYVLETMSEHGWRLGGESSGHIICADVTTTGDGIISALQVLSALATTGQSLHALLADVRKLPQTMINVRVNARPDLACPEISASVADIEQRLAGRGRVLLRPSGTEPVVRVMVEGECPDEVQRFATEIAAVVESTQALN